MRHERYLKVFEKKKFNDNTRLNRYTFLFRSKQLSKVMYSSLRKGGSNDIQTLDFVMEIRLGDE